MSSGGSIEASRPAMFDWQLCITLLLIVGLVAPLVVVPGTFFPYVVPRNILFRVAIELAAAACVLRLVLGNKQLELRGEYVLHALGAFLFAITVSAVFSPARSHSLFGDFERMGGVWAWLHLVVFFLLLRTLDERYLSWLLHTALAVSVAASVHAIVGHVSGVGGGLTIVGNPGLFAGYLLLAIAIGLYLANANAEYRWLYVAVGAIDLAALLLTQNRSSVLGLAAGGFTGTVLLALSGDRARRRWILLTVVAAAVAAATGLVAIVGTAGDSVLSNAMPGVLRRIAATDLGGVDASRTIQWDAALAGFRDRPLLGYGPENHHLVWSAHFDPRSQEFGTEVFDRAHNQFLELLATTGILGAIAFVWIWGAIGYSLWRAFSEERLSVRELSVLGGVNVAYATYLIFWFVDINAAMIWMLVAALIASRCKRVSVLRDRKRPVSRVLAVAGVLVTGSILVFVLHHHAYIPIRASVALATLDSYRGDRHVAFGAVQTIATSSAPQTSHTGPVLAEFIGSLVSEVGIETLRKDSAQSEQLDHALQTGIAAFDAELARDPLNDRLHTSAAGLLIEASDFYGSKSYLERSIKLLKRAIELSPRRTQQRRLLAKAFAEYSYLGETKGH